MKTNYCKILLLFLLLGSSIKSYCQTYITIDSIEYSLNSDNTASVHSCYKKTGDCTIPKIINYSYHGTYLITFIDRYAFYGCTGLTSITIPNSVTSIDYGAFSECTGLTSITIPNSVTFIDDGAFFDCTNLEEFIVDSSNTKYTALDGVLFNKSLDALIAYPNGKSSNCTIPNSVIYIADYAFHGCTELTSIIIPNSVIYIGKNAFHGCTELTSITIPNSVTSIDGAFSGCTELTSITIPNSVTSIGYNAFSGCTGLKAITIPNSVTSIYNAFHGCTGLKAITIPNSVTSIDGAFSGCTGLTSITIPNSVTSINDAFSGCTGLTLITIPNSVTSIDGAFSGCTGLTSATIPNSVTDIGDHAFSGCTGFTSVTIPNSVTVIGDYAFSGCTGLTSVTIPNSVTDVGDDAFNQCTELLEVVCLSPTPPKYNTRVNADCILFYYNTYNNGTLYVPIGSVNKYTSAYPWSLFDYIIEKDLTGIKSIKNTPYIYTTNKSIIIENDNSNINNINVYSHDGLLVKAITTDEKHTEIPVNKSGMYIVKTNSDIQKIIVK